MSDRVFFDTNIICYAFDLAEPEKRDVCEKLLERVVKGEIVGVISNQVLGETFNASVIKIGMPIEKARTIIKSLIASEKWEKINYDQDTIQNTLDNVKSVDAPFWDLLIAQTMLENNVHTIYTENEGDFDGIPGIKVINPFK